MARPKYKTVDEYINSFPKQTQVVLESLRQLITEVAPQAEEMISYQIAAFKVNGKYLIYFAGFPEHVGLYPIHPSDFPFGAELSQYVSGKATLRFPLDRPLPVELIRKVVKFKLSQI